MEIKLSGIYVLAGAAGELGKVLGPALRSAGADVVMIDSRDSELRELGGRIGARTLTADLQDFAQARAVVREVEETGAIRGLIHLVGAFAKHRAEHADDALYDGLMHANVRTLVAMVTAVLPGMIERREGFIAGITTNLVWGHGSGANMTLYAAAKGAVAHYLAALEREVRSVGIGVSVMYPLSSFDTATNRETTPDIDPSTWLDLDEIAAGLIFAASRGARGRLVEIPMVSAYSNK